MPHARASTRPAPGQWVLWPVTPRAIATNSHVCLSLSLRKGAGARWQESGGVRGGAGQLPWNRTHPERHFSSGARVCVTEKGEEGARDKREAARVRVGRAGKAVS